jgi:DNA-binding transcriptional LysR family regulator
MNYTLHQLHIFVTIVETKSITKASEILHLTQPAVSIQLRNFQDQFDIPLTEVIGRKLYVTSFGHEIAMVAADILRQVTEINHKTLAYKGHLMGQLRIAVVSTGKYVMPYFLADFMSEHAGIELKMDVTNKSKVLESLELNEVDFALVSVVPPHLAIEQLELLPNHLFMVGRYANAARAARTVNDVCGDLPLIHREMGSGTRQSMEKFLEKHKVQTRRTLELTSNEAVKQAVLAGLGNSIMPLIGIRNELQQNELQIIPIKGLPIKTSWRLIWLRGKKHAPAAKAFLKHLKTNKSTIVERNFHWCAHYIR